MRPLLGSSRSSDAEFALILEEGVGQSDAELFCKGKEGTLARVDTTGRSDQIELTETIS